VNKNQKGKIEMKAVRPCLVLVIFVCITATSSAQQIFDAAKANDLEKVNRFIERDASLMNVEDSNVCTCF
jgi:hypothetical protein